MDYGPVKDDRRVEICSMTMYMYCCAVVTLYCLVLALIPPALALALLPCHLASCMCSNYSQLIYSQYLWTSML